LLIFVCGGVGPEYLFSDSKAHGVLVALVLALWAVALCLVRVGTLQLLHRAVYTVGVIDALLRPVRPWAAGPRRSAGSQWPARIVFGVGVLACVAATLPDQVNAVAYLTDSTSTAVFLPLSYVPDCGRDGCTTRTAGVMEASDRPAVWPGELPLGRALPVQAPAWPTGPGQTLVTSDQAVPITLAGMIIDALAVGIVSGCVLSVRRRLRSRQRPAIIRAAWTGRRPSPRRDGQGQPGRG
jgi:hypothetical protein